MPMTRAMCIKCFSEKHGCWTDCGGCGFVPHGRDQLALSLVLSDHFIEPEEFPSIKRRFVELGEVPEISDDVMDYALASVKDAEGALKRQGLLSQGD